MFAKQPRMKSSSQPLPLFEALVLANALGAYVSGTDAQATRSPRRGPLCSDSAGRRGGQLREHGGLPLKRLMVAVEGITVGQLAGVEVADMRPVGVLPDQHP